MNSTAEEKDEPDQPGIWTQISSWFANNLARKVPDSTLKEALEEAIERSDEDEEMSNDERTILRNMLSVGELTVHDIMVPRSNIVAVDHHITLTELKQMITDKQHTRMPVYDEELDTLKGFIHLKDLVPVLAGDVPFDMDELVREVMFIAPSMKLIDLLVKMREEGSHMAIIVDEYGGTDGLVTLEDIFEALVGEIQDEHDFDDPELEVRRIASNRFLMDARLKVEAIYEETGLDLREYCEDADYDTLGGFIFGLLHRVPLTGELIHVDGLGQLRIIDADPRRIRRVQMNLNFTPITALQKVANAS